MNDSLALPVVPASCAPQLEVIRGLAQALAADCRVQACWLHGSFARGEADAFSDVDLEAAASAEMVQDLLGDPLPLLVRGGQRLWHWGGGTPQFARFGAVYRGPVIADIGVYNLEATAVPRAGLPPHVLFDRCGLLGKPGRLVHALARDDALHWREVQERLDFFWVWALTALRFLISRQLPLGRRLPLRPARHPGSAPVATRPSRRQHRLPPALWPGHGAHGPVPDGARAAGRLRPAE